MWEVIANWSLKATCVNCKVENAFGDLVGFFVWQYKGRVRTCTFNREPFMSNQVEAFRSFPPGQYCCNT